MASLYMPVPATRSGAADVWIDAAGGYILPGLVDLHSDAIEKEIEPRPGAFFRPLLAFSELEKKTAGQGITTMFHSFSFAGAEWGVRQDATAAAIIRSMVAAARQRALIRNKIHLRFEITNYRGLPEVLRLVEERGVDLVSFMDHTPGQGQYPTVEDYRRYMEKTYHMPFSDVEKIIAAKREGGARAEQTIGVLRDAAQRAGIPLAAHDDDSAARVAYFCRHGVTLHEFPVNLDAAQAACRAGHLVAVGAPNVVRDCSTGKGMRAREAITAGVAHILCSDYYPPSLLQAVFKLAHEAMSLPAAVNMASLAPARAAGLPRLGSLAPGQCGDAIVVNMRGTVPVVTHTVVGGIQVYGINYREEARRESVREELPA